MTKIDYSELTSVQQTVQQARLAILDNFNPINTAINEFSEEPELTGDSWDSAKDYLTQFPPIVTGVFNTLAEVGETLDLYLSSFQSEVGTPKNQLNSEDLIDLNNRLKNIKSEKASILAEIQRGANMVKYGPQTTMFGTSFSSLGTTALDNSIEDLNKDIEILEKYIAFEATHANDFSVVQETLTQLKTGLSELNRSVSFESSTGNFSTIALKDKEWYKNISKYNESQPTERLEMVKTYKAMYRENGTLLGYEVVYEIYRNGEKNEELTTKMTDMMKEAQLGELGNFILETTGINDFYRYFNGVDPITGEKLTNNQRALSGLLGLLGAVSTAEGIKMLTNLQKGYAMMQGVDIADDLAEASSFGPMLPEDATKYKQFWKDVADGKSVYDRLGVENPISKLKPVGKQPYIFGEYNPDPAKNIYGPGEISHPLEWNQTIDGLKNSGVEVVEKANGTMAYAPKTELYPPQLNIDGTASYSALMHEQQHYLDDLANGFPGMEYMFYPKNQLKMEFDAYMKEIQLAEQAGNKILANQLYENYIYERMTILGK